MVSVKQWSLVALALAMIVVTGSSAWATDNCSSCPQGNSVEIDYEVKGELSTGGITIKGDFAQDGLGKTEYGLRGIHRFKTFKAYRVKFNDVELSVPGGGGGHASITVRFPHCFSHVWTPTGGLQKTSSWSYGISMGTEAIPDFWILIIKGFEFERDGDNAGGRASQSSQAPSATPSGGGGGSPPTVQGEEASASTSIGMGNVLSESDWLSAGKLVVGGGISGDLASPSNLHYVGMPQKLTTDPSGDLVTSPATDGNGQQIVKVFDQNNALIPDGVPANGQIIQRVETPNYIAEVEPVDLSQTLETATSFRIKVSQVTAGGNEFLSSYTFDKVPVFGANPEFEEGLKVTQNIRGEITHEEVSLASSLTGQTGQSLFQGQLDGNQAYYHGTYTSSSDAIINPAHGDPERFCTHIEYRDGEVISSRVETYRLYDWGEEMIALEEDPTPGPDGHPDGGADSRNTTWDYYTDLPTDPNSPPGSCYGKLKSTTSNEGYWSFYTYTDGGAVAKMYEPIGHELSTPLTAIPISLPAGVKETVYQYNKFGRTGSEVLANIGGITGRINKTHSVDYNLSSSASIQYAHSGGIHTEQAIFNETVQPAKGRPFTTTISLIQSGATVEIETTDYTYDDGTWDGSAFIVDGSGAGPDLRIIEEKMVAPSDESVPLDYLPNLSTRSVRIETGANGLVKEATEIYLGAGNWDPVTVTEYIHDDRGRVIAVKKDGALVSGTVYVSEKEVKTIDSSGRVTRTEYHDDGTLWKTTVEAGGPGVGDIVTEYNRQGRTTTVTVNGIVDSVTTVDCLGRTVSSTDRLGRITRYSYTLGGAGYRSSQKMWRDIVDDAGLSQELATVTTSNADGSLDSITGNAVVPEQKLYDLHPVGAGDAFIATTTMKAPAGAVRRSTTINRWDGSPYQVSTPDPSDPLGTATVTQEYHYDTASHGRLMRVSSTAANVTDQVYGYDPVNPAVLSAAAVLGKYSYSGLDGLGTDADGIATLASGDRLTISVSGYEKDTNQIASENEGWFRVNTTTRLKTAGNATEGYQSVTKQRLRSHAAGSGSDPRFEALTLQTTESGEELEQRRQYAALSLANGVVTPSDKIVTQTITSPRSSEDAISVTENGYLVSSKSGVAAAGKVEEYFYNSLGQLISQTDVRGTTTTFKYNGLRQRISSTDALGNKTQYEYAPASHHAAGQVSHMINPEGEITETLYTLRGQVAEVKGDGAYRRVYAYDQFDQLATLTTYRDDTTPSVTEWEYYPATGLLHRKIYNSNGSGSGSGETDYEYHPSGRLWKRETERGAIVCYTYNAMGDRIYVDYEDIHTPNIDTPSSSYDRLGRLTQLTQQFENLGDGIVNFAYEDDVDRLKSVSYASNHPYLPDMSVHYNLDTYNRADGYDLKKGSSIIGDQVDYSYDGRGRFDGVSLGVNEDFGYTYESDTRIINKSSFESTTSLFSSERNIDRLGRIASVINRTQANSLMNITAIAGYQYDKAGRRTTLTREDGTYWKYAYNKRGELIDGRKHLNDDTLLAGQQFSFDYDGIGNRKTANYGGDTQGNNMRTITYDSNNENQYTGISYASSGITRYANVLAKTPANQSVTITAAGTNHTPVPQSTSSNSPQWFRAEIAKDGTEWEKLPVTVSDGSNNETGDLWLPPVSYAPEYDDDGNLTNDGRWEYTWDSEQRLVRMHSLKNSGTQLTVNTDTDHMVLDFAYDWQGRRIAKKVTGSGTNNVLEDTRFIYDQWNLSAELDGQNNLDIIREYFWGIDLSGTMQGAGGVGGLLGVRAQTGEMVFPSYDGNGNIIAWSEDGTEALEVYDYDPFGNLLSKQQHSPIPGGDIPYGFSTKYTDQETGLLYYGYRHYDPVTGRWPSRDPLGLNWETGEFNEYAFILNEPVYHVDILGLVALPPPTVLPPNRGGGIGPASGSFKDDPATQAIAAAAVLIITKGKGKKKPPAKPKKKPKKKKCCKPCKPGVGTVMHEIAKPGSRQRGRHAQPGHNKGHVKLWIVRQTPYPACKCVWNKNKPFTLENTQTPPAGSIPGGPPKGMPGGGGPEK